jgi:hypothetical protein
VNVVFFAEAVLVLYHVPSENDQFHIVELTEVSLKVTNAFGGTVTEVWFWLKFATVWLYTVTV